MDRREWSLHLACGEKTAPPYIWYNLWMLLRLCPGLTAYKSLDQAQRGIKLTTVQIEYSTCVWGRDAASQQASEQVRLMHMVVQLQCGLSLQIYYTFNSTAIEKASCIIEAPPVRRVDVFQYIHCQTLRGWFNSCVLSGSVFGWWARS